MLSAKPIFSGQQYNKTAIQGATILTSVRCKKMSYEIFSKVVTVFQKVVTKIQKGVTPLQRAY